MRLIQGIAEEMSRNMIPSSPRAKQQFRELKQETVAQRELLREAGFECEAINRIATANVNRPDRDDPCEAVSASDWVEVSQIED